MSITRPVIRPHQRDQQLSPLPIDFDPRTLGWILDEGARGNLCLQDQLFNTMEDTWDRLRTNLNKFKRAVCKLPFHLQPWTGRGREPSPSALEKAALVEGILDSQQAASWEGQHNFLSTVYELLDAVARGFSVLEIDWQVKDGRYVPTGTRRVPVTCLGFQTKSALSGVERGESPARMGPEALMLFPERDPNRPRRFKDYPHKFLVGIYRGKSGHLAECAQLRALAHLWLGRMLGWEWMATRAELFGIPIRWATYDPWSPQAHINQLTEMVRQMGTSAWGVFPEGTELNILSGNISGVSGPNEPTERLISLANRACDLLFLGQAVTSHEGSRLESFASGNIHRDTELDLYENYASYVMDVINHQLIPSIIELNYGETSELPSLQVEFVRPDRDQQAAERDKLLFKEMGLPVSKQWLYDRHKIPAPGPGEDLFQAQR